MKEQEETTLPKYITSLQISSPKHNPQQVAPPVLSDASNHQHQVAKTEASQHLMNNENSVQFALHAGATNGTVEQTEGSKMLPLTAVYTEVKSGNVNNNHSEKTLVRQMEVQAESENAEAAPQLRRTRPANRGELRHAMSEILPNEAPSRRRSQTMANVKEHAYARLEQELEKAQEELKLKDEEVGKLLKVRDQMGEELEDLTASLFEEANNMVQEANVKRMHSEKRFNEASQQIEVLQAEVVALKELVLTSTPNSPNKHLHPQINAPKPEPVKKESKISKPFWKTHRRSTSHHEFTKEARQEAEAVHEAKNDRCKDIDPMSYNEFIDWRKNPILDKDIDFLRRVFQEDIRPCLNFSNTELSMKLTECVMNNTLTMEPIPGDSSYPRKCHLTENNKLCNYKIKLGDDFHWYSISQLCRNRIAAVCDFYTYIRYVNQGLVKSEDKETFYEIARLRKTMALARLGYS